jgi:hypothetical protein
MEHGGREKGRKIKEKEIRGKIVGKLGLKCEVKAKEAIKEKRSFWS